MNINGKTYSPQLIKTVAIIVFAAVILGLLMGLAFGSSGNRAEAARPAPTVTVTATAAPEVREVVSVPQECLDALDNADEGFTIAGKMFGEYGDGIGKLSKGDVDGATTALSNINELTQSLDNVSPNYRANKESCRAAAQ